MSDFGYGQQGPNSSTSDYNVQAFIVHSILARCRTFLVVEVMAVSNDGGVAAVGTVDVRPLVNMVDGNGNATPHETIFGLPYARVQGGANAIILDPKVGDFGVAGICDRDISSVKSEKKRSNPGSTRSFSLADGVYLFGVLNGVPEQYVRFSSSGIEIKSATEVTIVAPTVKVDGNLRVTGNVTGDGGAIFTGDVIGAGKSLPGHIHSGVQTGGGNSGPPV